MYRVGKRHQAAAHGTYIRPAYLEVWTEMYRLAKRYNVSLSAFVNFALFVFMTGAEPSDSPLTGRLPFSHHHERLDVGNPRRQHHPRNS